MRFYPDGPNIPAELLEARDSGGVVFFCGAGISMPAGLPSFTHLAMSVISELGVPADSPSRRLLEQATTRANPDFVPPMDMALGILQKDYGIAAVEQIVRRKLRTPRKANLAYHQIALRLSADVSGNARLVTTNFDLLFEAARPRMRRYVAPVMPDIAQDQPFNGLVYLHGRLGAYAPARNVEQRLILGSGDFGRAYLADGWASEFLRALLARYTVVLLGYSADDPPVRYLLEGMHSRPVQRAQSIYAFAEARPGENEMRWWDRGVKAIPYVKEDSKHSGLWKSLAAWADRAENPAKWRRRVMQIASSNPRQLSPQERGQVVDLVRSASGAREFANASPSPPAEWLCVFDSLCRYAKPSRDLTDINNPPFDPLMAYGLDDDPPRDIPQNGRPEVRGVNLLAPISADEHSPNQIRLVGPRAGRSGTLPSRLHSLARWISKISHEPTAPWWAARNVGMHSTLQQFVEWSMDARNTSISPTVRLAWQLIFESFETRVCTHTGH